ncbi:hypothetical protein Tco_0260214 [Tanacetum coccineum]
MHGPLDIHKGDHIFYGYIDTKPNGDGLEKKHTIWSSYLPTLYLVQAVFFATATEGGLYGVSGCTSIGFSQDFGTNGGCCTLCIWADIDDVCNIVDTDRLSLSTMVKEIVGFVTSGSDVTYLCDSVRSYRQLVLSDDMKKSGSGLGYMD